MKKALLVSTCLFYAAGCYCQANNYSTDSLKALLQNTKADTVKVSAMHNLSYNYIYSNADSSMYYAQKALHLAKTTHYLRGEIRALNDIGNTLTNSGNYIGSLEVFVEALQKAEELGDVTLESATLGNIGETYANQGDYRQAIIYARRGLQIDLAQNDSLYLVYDYLNLGDYYVKNSQADSALIFENKAYELNMLVKNDDLMSGILSSLGDIQARMGNDDIALPYFRKAIASCKANGNTTDLSRTLISMAEVFSRAGKKDSAISYLKTAYARAREASFQDGMLKASSRLASLYETVNNDSTLKYLKLSVAIKDSGFSLEKIKQVQSLTFAEQLRQQELEELKLKQSEDRRHNLQLIGIAAFIPLFFGGVALLRKRTVKESTIKFMGLLGLLLLFEFISILIHPYITRLSNHAPVYMLIMLVIIASILVPAHHRMEEWVKEKFAHKPKRAH